MRIRIVCPAPPGTLYGNRISAARWAGMLRQLGHRAVVETHYGGQPCDLLIALHAKRSAGAVFEFHRLLPDAPVIVALTGTDLYREIHRSAAARRALDIATRLVALQPLAHEQLAPGLRSKLRVIHQSAEPASGPASRSRRFFQVCVVGHLRRVKDPFRAAMAARRLPAASRIRVVHAGAAMSAHMERRARAEEQRNRRYRWLGELPRWKARRLIASSHVLVLSSRMEGGANVISEAVVEGTPVLASAIPGSVGLLGADYPGYYEFGDTEALRRLLLRAETDAGFYGELRSACARCFPLFRPERERTAWRSLLNEVSGPGLKSSSRE
ncbi:MAG TPA: selenoneine biosynthesis selenosugar synthase SenB [Bryobacteraceae bacterium]|nr:selenoneine biosynthesis selenosugar synthase SenB [Bryobacteraceae bacterium]